MLVQAEDFRKESEALLSLLARMSDEDWDRPTKFKAWTVNDILVHLHFWNMAADISLNDVARFKAFYDQVADSLLHTSLREFERGHVTERGWALVDVWRDFFRDMARRWLELDPSRRVKWIGPDMSVRSAITARQMETWAHAQAIFDLLGVERVETDRIRNIVVLGVNTFAWSFMVHGQTPPETLPEILLTSPSGQLWRFGDANGRIEGSAVDFCRVLTQTRNVADTGLVVTGEAARDWMATAQSFAGPPEMPPPPGARGPHRPLTPPRVAS